MDKERVKANRANYKKNNKKKKPRPHKWRLPEANENGKRTVDGKLYKWNATKEFWEEISAPESGLQPTPETIAVNSSASVAAPAAAPVELVTVDDSDTAAKIQLQLANLLNNTSQIRDAVL